MKGLLTLAVLAFLVVPGCGDDTTVAAVDMAIGMDLATPPAPGDMAKIATCQGVLSCIAGCQGNAQCTLACQQNASTAAQQNFVPFAVCLYASCSTLDGGTGMCQLPLGSDSSQTCGQCLGTKFVGAVNAGASCHSEYANCASH
jgi:hypothetical protein